MYPTKEKHKQTFCGSFPFPVPSALSDTAVHCLADLCATGSLAAGVRKRLIVQKKKNPSEIKFSNPHSCPLVLAALSQG